MWPTDWSEWNRQKDELAWIRRKGLHSELHIHHNFHVLHVFLLEELTGPVAGPWVHGAGFYRKKSGEIFQNPDDPIVGKWYWLFFVFYVLLAVSLSNIQSEASGYNGYPATIKRSLDNLHYIRVLRVGG